MDKLIDKSSILLAYLENLFENNISNLGKFLSVVGCFLGFFSIALNKLSKPVSISSFMVIRALINSHISYQVLKATHVEFKSTKSYLLMTALRTFIGVLCTYVYVKGIAYLELNHFYSLVNTQPIFTFWLGYYFMGEVYRHDRLICSILAVLGVTLVVNPEYFYLDFSDKDERYENFKIGVSLALFGAFLKAVILIVVKNISKSSPYKTMLFFEGGRVFIPAFVMILAHDIFRFESWSSLLLAIGSGLMEYVYQILNIMSMRYERASVIGIIETTSIVYGFLFDITWYGKSVEMGSLTGTILIVGISMYLTSLK